MPMTNQISRDELRSAIADKLCAHFGVTAETATDEQVFQAAAIVIREILSRLHTFDSRTAPEREVHYLSMEFLMGRSLMKDAFNLGIGDALTGALLARYRESMVLPNAFAHTAQEREAICLDAFLRAADPVETLLRLR
jgi:glucan phosphorylase